MKEKVILYCMIFIFPLCTLCKQSPDDDGKSAYTVNQLDGSMTIDANWEKPQWQKIPALEIRNYMGEIPPFKPKVNAKMMYDDQNIYIIFQVQDKFVRCITNQINGPVWEQSCAEFFFAPDSKSPDKYFNLEMTCGGTPLMFYNVKPRIEFTIIDSSDIKLIEIAHSLPELVDPEIKDSLTWYLECRIPIELLKKFSDVTTPKPGVVWKANFYKIADKTSNPHYITWSPVSNPEPDFHLPEFFGTLIFD